MWGQRGEGVGWWVGKRDPETPEARRSEGRRLVLRPRPDPPPTWTRLRPPCPPRRLAGSLGTSSCAPPPVFYSFVSTHCPDVLITEGLGTLSRCDLSGDTSDGVAAKHGRHSDQQAARLLASRSQLYLAGPLDVDAAPKCVLYVIILAFSSEPPPLLLNLFLVCVCVWWAAISGSQVWNSWVKR